MFRLLFFAGKRMSKSVGHRCHRHAGYQTDCRKRMEWFGSVAVSCPAQSVPQQLLCHFAGHANQDVPASVRILSEGSDGTRRLAATGKEDEI